MKKIYLGFFAGMVALLALGGVLAVALGDREFSANENRYLTQFPSFEWKEFISGEWQEDMTNAFNDQFIQRDLWTQTSTSVKKTLGYKDIGGVYLGKENYYFEKIMNQDISQTNYFQNLRFVNYLARSQEDATVSLMLVPSPGTVLEEYLPAHATLYDSEGLNQQAQDLLQNVNFVDLRDDFQEISQKRQIYYKTDHHWSLYGAYTGAMNYYESIGAAGKSYEEYGIKAVSNSFYGTLYSKALDRKAIPDEIDAPMELPPVKVYCDGVQKEGIYDKSKLEEKDQYAYFFGGNYGEVDIINESAASEKKLLMIKDSFANSMVPFLMEEYTQIKMVDMRYFKGSLQELAEEYQAEEILVLYEMSNFAQDENLDGVIR